MPGRGVVPAAYTLPSGPTATALPSAPSEILCQTRLPNESNFTTNKLSELGPKLVAVPAM
jgi:hypothetical protein